MVTTSRRQARMGRFIYLTKKKFAREKMVSAYEQERLDNIARNNAVLDALGLGGNNSLKPRAPPRAPKPAATQVRSANDELRRSSRVAGSNVKYCELSDAFFAKRSGRPTGHSAPSSVLTPFKMSKPPTLSAQLHNTHVCVELVCGESRRHTAPQPEPETRGGRVLMCALLGDERSVTLMSSWLGAVPRAHCITRRGSGYTRASLEFPRDRRQRLCGA